MRRNALLRWLLFLGPLAACIAFYAPTLSGAFLSDDYAVIGALATWAGEGGLGHALLSKFYSGLDAPSNYYRPLSMLSFGVNFVLAGAEPLSWRLVNLSLHLASGALVFAIARHLLGDAKRSDWAPAAASTLFLFFPTSAEAVAWVSGRYDLLALFFSLASLACFLRAARWSDRWGVMSLIASACAFASKESAALVPVFVTALAIARHPLSVRGVSRGLSDAAPWIFLALTYFVARAAIFGSAFRVYAGTSPLDAVLSGDALRALSSVPAWLAAALPLRWPRVLFLASLSALVVLGAVRCLGRREMRTWSAIAATLFLSVALLLPHVSALAPTGEQGRLFYMSSALLALLAGYALLPPRREIPRARLQSVMMVAVALAAIGAEILLLQASVLQWTSAGAQAKALARELPILARDIPPEGYGLVLAPDHLGSVPFARNAQGGFVLPPVQASSLSSRLIVQTPEDLPAWPENIRRGLVDALRRFPLPEVWNAVAAGKASGSTAPTHYFCWSSERSALKAISLVAELDDRRWMDAWRDALAAGGCGALAAEIGAR